MGVFTAKANNKKAPADGEYEKAPTGTHPAVCVAILDMGTQVQEFQGKKTDQHRLFFVWELVTEQMKGGNNHVVGIDLTLSLNEKAKLRQWIEARRGEKIVDGTDYDASDELGKPCLLTVANNDAGYPKVNGMSGIPKGLVVGAATYTPIVRTLEDYIADGAVTLPEWIPWLYGESLTDHIMRCKEFNGIIPKQPKSTLGDGSPTGGVGTPKSGPPKKKIENKATNPAPRKWWLDTDPNGDGQPVELEETAIVEMAMAKKFNPNVAVVAPDGSDEWAPVATAIPATAVPF